MPNFTIKMNNNIPEVSVQDVFKNGLQNSLLIDCRRPEEFNNELGHISGSKLVTLGSVLENYLTELSHKNKILKKNNDDFIIFICRSGMRSGNAALLALEMGFKNAINMTGGMIEWNDQKLPVERTGTGK